MQKIGITGGIGSGKSFVASIFSQLDIPVYSADNRAKILMDSSEKLIQGIKKLFGENAYSKDGLNRKFIARQVFSNKPLLEELNMLVHPAVANDFSIWCNSHWDKKYVLKEAAILFESGANKQLDKTILVTAPTDIRIQRIIKRDKTSVSEVEQRMKNQWPTEKLMKLADYIIDNSGNKLILPQIIEIDSKLKN